MDYKPHSSRGKWKRCCSSCPICHTSIYFQRAFTRLERVQQLESHQCLHFLFKIHWIFFSNSSISILYQSSCWVFPGAQIHLMKFLHVGKAWCYDRAFMGKWVYGWCRKGDPYEWTYAKNSWRPGSFNRPWVWCPALSFIDRRRLKEWCLLRPNLFLTLIRSKL